jgi:pimeloyl-ACP methyl ester carboxylesterase
MKTLNINLAKPLLGALLLTISFTAGAQEKKPVKNVVLVHGAFADGSGYRPLFDILTKKGYNVTVVQNPLVTLEGDVLATTAALDKLDGPAILVGHSYAGSVITQAGNHPKVAALVYIAAYQPDKGESALEWAQTLPPAPENGILPPDEHGVIYYDKAKFHKGFCGDLPKDVADFMFASHGMFHLEALSGKITEAAWHKKPAYGIIATEDKSINPDIQRNMYKRSHTKVTEIKGSHVVFISHPKEVSEIIIQASKDAAK